MNRSKTVGLSEEQLEEISKSYAVTKNMAVAELIEEYDMSKPQARRYAMKNDGYTFADIARIERQERSTVQTSVGQGRDLIASKRMMP